MKFWADETFGRPKNTHDMNTDTPALTVDSVSHRYDQHQALNNVSFEVPSGIIFGLLGPNGSGKTTLFRLLATLLPLQEGSVQVLSFDLQREAAAIRGQIGITFQSPALDPRLSVRENLVCHGRIYGMNGRKLQQRIHQLLDDFQLTDRSTALVESLSGGLRRRVELAKGLLHGPLLLLLDEPSTGLDPAARRQFWDLVRQQQQRSETTIIVSTHLMDEAADCDQLLLLDRGQVLQHGSPQQLQASLSGQRLTLRTLDNAGLKARLEKLLLRSATETGEELCFRIDDAAAGLQQVMQQFNKQIVSAQVAQPTLEDVFIESTGRTLSADAGADDE